MSSLAILANLLLFQEINSEKIDTSFKKKHHIRKKLQATKEIYFVIRQNENGTI